MSTIEKRSITIVAALLLSLTCWQFSYARLADANVGAPSAAVAAHK